MPLQNTVVVTQLLPIRLRVEYVSTSVLPWLHTDILQGGVGASTSTLPQLSPCAHLCASPPGLSGHDTRAAEPSLLCRSCSVLAPL